MADQPSIDSVDRLHGPAPGLLFSTTSPSEMPKSLAFEFYLIKVFLEHNMNVVKKKICRLAHAVALWQAVALRSYRRSTGPTGERPPQRRLAGQECGISSISALR